MSNVIRDTAAESNTWRCMQQYVAIQEKVPAHCLLVNRVFAEDMRAQKRDYISQNNYKLK